MSDSERGWDMTVANYYRCLQTFRYTQYPRLVTWIIVGFPGSESVEWLC